MSRTYRKNAYFGTEISKEKYISRELAYSKRSFFRETYRRFLKGEELEKAKQKFIESHAAQLHDFKKKRSYYAYLKRYFTAGHYESVFNYYDSAVKKLEEGPNLTKRFYVREYLELTEEEITKNASDYFDEYFRDGKGSETPRRSGFKKEAARHTRRNNRILEKKIVNGDDTWENYAYTNDHDGDHFVWNWW